MAKDCLVTQLKGTVNNNNLPELGKLVYSGVDIVAIRFAGTAGSISWVNGQVTNTAGTVTYESPIAISASAASRRFVPGGSNAKIVLENKYALTHIAWPCDLNELKYCGNLIIVGVAPLDGYKMRGDIANLALLSNLEEFISECNNVSELLYGDIKVFGGLTKIKNLNFRRQAGIYGAFEDVIAGQIHNGRTGAVKATGIEIKSLNSSLVNITFKGVYFGYANGYFVWSATGNTNEYLIEYYNSSDVKQTDELITVDANGDWEVVTAS